MEVERSKEATVELSDIVVSECFATTNEQGLAMRLQDASILNSTLAGNPNTIPVVFFADGRIEALLFTRRVIPVDAKVVAS